MRGLKD